MSNGTTIFERWKDRRRETNKDTEEKYINPLDVRLGDVVTIDALDWRDLDLRVHQFRVVNRIINGEEFPFTDYFLRARTIDDDEYNCILRYVPIEDPDVHSGTTHLVYLLHIVDEHEYVSETIHHLDSGSFGYGHVVEGDDGTKVIQMQEFPSRVNDITMVYPCSVDVVQDKNNDGEVEDDEVETYTMRLWDFWRDIEEDGQEFTEYLFVEIDDKDEWTTLYHGEEVCQTVVNKL
jgi:hypothetical protein